jgi:hypothetical protein
MHGTASLALHPIMFLYGTLPPENVKRQVLSRSVSFTSCLIFDAPLVVLEEPK